MDLPPDLAQALRLGLAGRPVRELSAAAEALSERYRGGPAGAAAVQSEQDVMAYAAARLPATFAAVGAALREVAGQRPGWSPGSMIDAGAGPGTAAWAAAATWPELGTIRHLERDRRMIAFGAGLSRRAGKQAVREARWLEADLTREWQEAPADIVVAAYCLNEIPGPRRSEVVARLWATAADTLVVVEPGTPGGYEIINRVRTHLIAEGGAVLAPCTHDGLCPIAAREGDWCHFSQRLARSRLHRRAKGGQAPFEDEKFSYVAVSRRAASHAGGRVIRRPYVRPGAITLDICSVRGAATVVVTRGDRRAFRAARDLRWGSALQEGTGP
jgi:ribosomal protein RSM22 (predicted rRNA methylase)